MKTAREREEVVSATLTQELVLVFGCTVVLMITAVATQPAWWTEQGAVVAPQIVTNNGVITTNYIPNDYAVATQGQLKQFTVAAYNELNANLTNSGGAGAALSNLVTGWQQDYATNNYSSSSNSYAPYKPADFQAVNVGQLKYVANLVYSQLAQAGYTGLIPSWIQVNTNTDNSAANVGQLKEVFDFDLTVPANAPSNLTAVAPGYSGVIDLSWSLPSMNNAISITVQQSADGGVTWTNVATLSPTSTSYQATGLDPTQTYTYQLSAGNGAGTTTSASPSSPTPPVPPPRYAVIDLGTNLVPEGLSNTGNVVLDSNPYDPLNPQPFYRWNGIGSNAGHLDTLTWGTNSVTYPRHAWSIDNKGTVVGICVGGGTYAAAYWPSNSLVPLPITPNTIVTGEPFFHLSAYDGTLIDYNGTIYGLGAGSEGYFNGPYDVARQGVWWTPNESESSESYSLNASLMAPLSFTTLTQTNASGQVNEWNSQSGSFRTAVAAKDNCTLISQSNFDPTYEVVSYIDSTSSSAIIDGYQVPDCGGIDISTVGDALLENHQQQYMLYNGRDHSEATIPGTVYLGALNHSTRNQHGANGSITPVECPQILGVDSNFNVALYQQNPDTKNYDSVLVNSLIPKNNGWTDLSPSKINDSGAMIAVGTADGSNSAFAAGSHGVMLLPAELAVDSNRDGTIVMANDAGNPNNVDSHGNPLPVDTTSQAKPYRFWLNNNEDQPTTWYGVPVPNTVPPVASSEDYLSNSIVSTLDLEDWTRLWIYTKGLNAAINSGAIKVGLKWSSTTNTPGIKIVKATDSDGGIEYLSDTTGAAATAQATSGGSPRPVLQDANDSHTNIVPTSASADFVFPTSVWANLSDTAPKTYFLFEGTSRGQGQLQIVFLKSDGTTLLGSGGNLWLDIRDIKEMYQREIASGAGPAASPPTEPYASNSGAFNDSSINSSLDTNNPFVAPANETSQCVLFVHGWYTDWNGFTDYSERFFKRLWWQGYKGRFIGFTWPALSGASTYNSSEWNAWLYGRAFMNYANSVKGNYTNFTVAAHSQGNVVVGAAIQEGLTIPTYIMLQAALPTGCYTTNSTYNNYTPFINQEAVQPTPDLAANLGYRGFIMPEKGNVGAYYCFFNPQDFALATGSVPYSLGLVAANWEANQLSYKPDSNPGQSGDGWYGNASAYGATAPFFSPSGSSTYRNLTDIHESMSFVARPRSKAVGADTNSAPVFVNGINLQTTYGFGGAETDHSGQFLRNYHQVYPLYQQLEGIIVPTTP